MTKVYVYSSKIQLELEYDVTIKKLVVVKGKNKIIDALAKKYT